MQASTQVKIDHAFVGEVITDICWSNITLCLIEQQEGDNLASQMHRAYLILYCTVIETRRAYNCADCREVGRHKICGPVNHIHTAPCPEYP